MEAPRQLESLKEQQFTLVLSLSMKPLPFPLDLQPKKQFYVLKKYLLKKVSVFQGE